MIIIDTSVWIDFLNEQKNKEVLCLEQIIASEEAIAYTGIILQELFQGLKNDTEALELEEYFSAFIEIQPQKSTYRLAGKIYRDGRKRGLTIRKSVDCLISACAIENNCLLLHKDRDFDFISQVSDLQIYKN